MIARQIRQGRRVELCGKTHYIVGHLGRLQVGAGTWIEFVDIMPANENRCFPFVIEALCLPKDDPEYVG